MSLLIVLSVTAALIQAPAPVSTASISGRIVEDGSSSPVVDAQVTVMPMRSGPRFGSTEPPLSVRTGQDGRFVIRGLEPGRYRVAAQKSGYAMAFGPGAATSVEVVAGQEQSVELSLQRGAAIIGRVVNDAGEPLVNLRVMAMRQVVADPRFTATSRQGPAGPVPAGPGVQTNDLGEFRLFGLPAGEYYVQVSPGFEFGRAATQPARTLVPTYFPDATDPGSAQTILVAAGQTSDAIVIRMADAPAFQVSGIVVDETGRPVANAMVRLDPDSETGPRFSYGRLPLQAHTSAVGAFSIGNVTTAIYTLIAIPPLVMSTKTEARPAVGGISFSSESSSVSGGMSGSGRVSSESRNGVTTQYRDDLGTKAQLAVSQGDVTGIQIVVRVPR